MRLPGAIRCAAEVGMTVARHVLTASETEHEVG
jgi:hypothetical protein